MRSAVLFLPVLAFCVAAFAQPAEQEGYVPTSLLIPDEGPDFLEKWIGGQLRAMGEPSFARSESLAGFRRRFRLLVLPTFDPAYVVRIDEQYDGRAQVTAIRLNGKGGYRPGNVAERESYVLGRTGIRAFDVALRASRFTERPISEPQKSPPGTIVICADGVQFVLELVDSKGSHFLMRRQCDDLEPLMPVIEAADALRRTVGSDLPAYLKD